MKQKAFLFGILFSFAAWANVNVVTTTEDLASIVTSIGGDKVKVDSIAKGTQDPHFVQAKPSFMVKISNADLVVAIGLQLEVGWLPLLLQGARQPKLLPGREGYLDVSEAIIPIEVVTAADRSQGDVHPFGNPHYMGDPERVIEVSKKVALKLGELDKANAAFFKKQQKVFEADLKGRIKKWKARLANAKGLKVIGYHRTFNYVFQFFDIKQVGYLEPKPGIPPTPSHILELIEKAKSEKVKLIVVENYFDMKPPETVAEKSGAQVVCVPAYVGGDDTSKTYVDWYETLVTAFEKGIKLSTTKP